MAPNIRDLEYIADQMDSRFKGPLGMRFGWDGILGLIPGIGDVVTSSFSFYILMRTAALGAPPVIIAHMGLNILIDNVFDAIPVLGWIFDFVWKANQKNVQLLQRFSFDQHKVTWQSRMWVAGIVILIFALTACFVVGGFYLLYLGITYIQNLNLSAQNSW